MNRIDRAFSGVSLPIKFGIICALFLLALLLLMGQLVFQANTRLQTIHNEQQGLSAIVRLNELNFRIHEHSALGLVVINGDSSLQGKWLESRKAVDAAWGAVAAELKPEWVASLELKDKLEKRWQELSGRIGEITAQSSLVSHSAIADETLELIKLVADQSELTIDPELTSNYLMSNLVSSVPLVSHQLGELRAQTILLIDTNRLGAQNLQGVKTLLSLLKANQAEASRIYRRIESLEAPLDPVLFKVNDELSQGINSFDMTLQGFEMGVSLYNGASFYDVVTAVNNKAEALSQLTAGALSNLLDTRIQALKVNVIKTAGASLLLALFAVVFCVLIFSGLNQRVRSLLQHTNKIAAGELNVQLHNAGRDEIGLIAIAVEQLRNAQLKIVTDLKGTSGQLVDTAGQLAQSSSAVQSGASAQTDSAAAVASSIEELTVSIGQISQHAVDAQIMTKEAGQAALSGRECVKHTRDAMKEINNASLELSDTIHRLGERSNSISNIVNVIQEIANQTNLLALNAAIEAARAGEQGRGFAVVADEVGKLAEKTSDSTKEIAELVACIQQETNSAVAHVEGWSGMIKAGVNQSDKADMAMLEIEKHSELAAGAVTDITHAIGEQSEASTLIAQQIEQIASMTEQSSVAIRKVDVIVHDIQQFSQGLDAQVGGFKT